MTEEEKKAQLEAFNRIPKKVRAAVMLSLALGLVTLLRMPSNAYAAQLPLGKSVLYGLLLGFWIVISGGSLFARSRWSFVVLLVLALIPLPGLVGLGLRLQRLTLEGSLMHQWPDTLHCTIGLLQLVVTGFLLRYLLAKEVRDFVWKRTATEAVATPSAGEPGK